MVEIVQPGGSGSGSPLTVSDGNTTVLNVTEILFAGGTVANGGGGIADVTIVSGFTFLAATGTIDGTNAAFTFASKPLYVVSDGAWYRENNGWTWNSGALTVTMSVPPQTDIWGFA